MNKMLSQSKLFFKRNGSTILTCTGAVGVVTTSVLAVKATPKAMTLLKKAKQEKGEELSNAEIVKTAAPAYIPAALSGAATIACIFGANILNQKQQASLMSAYALLDRQYKEYKQKVTDLYGEEAQETIFQELAKASYDEEEVKTTNESDKKLFYDQFSGRYFESTIADVQRAEYQINRDLVMREWATLNEFYDYLGLDPIDGGDDLGWSPDMNMFHYWQEWIDFGHHKTVVGDDLECCIITMYAEPTLDWCGIE